MGIVGLVGVSTMCTLSFADSKDGDGDNQERDRRNVRSGFGACIEEDGIDYSGHDIPGERKTTANSQECADFAASITGGLYWTFNKKVKMCFVKSSNSGRRTDADTVSGNRMCGSI